MSDTLVVYYSRKGTTKTAAEKLADYLDCDITEITSPKKYRGLFGFIAGGKAAMSEQKIRIDEPGKSAEDYERVIICTPVWASNIPPAVRTYLTIENNKIKNHSFLLTSAGSDYAKALKKLEGIAGKPVKTVHFSAFERKSDVWTEKLIAFANEL